MDKKTGNFSIDEVKKFAQSPAGQRLAAMIQAQDQEAVQQVQSGNYDAALERLKGYLNTPEAQELLKQFGR